MRRKELKSVAYGMSDFFISRNNDLNGYWALGKVHMAAKDESVSNVVFKLIDDSVSVKDPEMRLLLNQHKEIFIQQMVIRKLPMSWIKEVTIHYSFETEITKELTRFIRKKITSDNKKSYAFIKTMESPSSCHVIITCDHNKTYDFLKESWSCPHNPKQENQRAMKYRWSVSNMNHAFFTKLIYFVLKDTIFSILLISIATATFEHKTEPSHPHSPCH